MSTVIFFYCMATTWADKVSLILRWDLLLVRARWSYLTRSKLRAVPQEHFSEAEAGYQNFLWELHLCREKYFPRQLTRGLCINGIGKQENWMSQREWNQKKQEFCRVSWIYFAKSLSKTTRWYEGIKTVLKREWGTVWHTWGRSEFPVERMLIDSEVIGHFRVLFSPCFKTSLSTKLGFFTFTIFNVLMAISF